MNNVRWADAGKGLAICLVVLVHTCNWLLAAGLGVPTWDSINEGFVTLRMPLFFLISGLFAGKWIHGSWHSLLTDKLLFLYWIFLLWSLIGSLFSLAGLAIQDSGTTTSTSFLGGLALSFIRPRFELWFIWALALFFVLAKLLTKWPLHLQLVLAAAASFIWQSGLISINIGWDGAAKNYLFFLVGAACRNGIFSAVDKTPLAARVGLIVLWGSVSVCTVAWDGGDILGLRFAHSLLGVAAGIALATLLVEVKWLRNLGRRTLPIYLAHTPIAILFALATSFGLFDFLPASVRAVMPIPVAAAAIVLSLAFHRWATDSILGFLYAVPRAINHRAKVAITRPVKDGEGKGSY